MIYKFDKKNIKEVFRTAYEFCCQQVGDKVFKIDIAPYYKNRTLEQNNFMWAVYKHIVLFWTDTGFMPDELNKSLKFINSDFLHGYFKCKYDIKKTSKLTTKEFGEYIDSIQRDMVEQTNGEYEPLEANNENTLTEAR